MYVLCPSFVILALLMACHMMHVLCLSFTSLELRRCVSVERSVFFNCVIEPADVFSIRIFGSIKDHDNHLFNFCLFFILYHNTESMITSFFGMVYCCFYNYYYFVIFFVLWLSLMVITF